MKAKKIVALLMAGVMMFGLVACGEKNSSTNGESSNNESNGSSESPQWDHLDWTKGADASGGKVTLRVVTWRQYDKAYYEELERRFEEKYDWIDVQLQITANSSAYYSNVQADITDGTAPDVMDMHRANMRDYARDGVLAPQTNFDYMEKYSKVAQGTSVIDGENYGFMLGYNYYGLIYNTDIFEKVGLAIPKTPEELVSVVNKLKDAGYGGIAYPAATNNSKFATNIVSICVGNDAGLELGIDDGSITDITTVDGVEEAFETIKYYVDNNIFYNAYEGISYEAAVTLFAQEKAPIMYGGTYMLGEAEQTYPDINFGYFAIPTYSGNSLNPSEPSQHACISASSKNLGAAKLWVEFLALPENSEYFCSNSKIISTIEGVTSDDEVMQMIKNSSEGFVLETPDTENSAYWYLAYRAVFDNVMLKKKDWKKEVEKLTRKLEDYDLSSLK